MSMSSIRLDALELSFSPYTLVGDANVFNCLDALELSLAHDALVSNATVLYCGAFFFRSARSSFCVGPTRNLLQSGGYSYRACWRRKTIGYQGKERYSTGHQ